jgi:hypothetical protein
MRSVGRILIITACVWGAALGLARADEPAMIGLAGGYSTRFQKPTVAVELLAPVGQSLHANVSLEYLEEGRVRHVTTSLDVQYRIRIHRRLLGWGGVGFGIRTDDPIGPRESTTRDFQADLLVGLGWEGALMPTLQVRVAGGKATVLGGFRIIL